MSLWLKLHHFTSPQLLTSRSFQLCSYLNVKKSILPPDDAQVIFINGKTKETLTFGALKRKAQEAKGKNLIHVDKMGEKKTIPTFRIANNDEIRQLLKRSKSLSTNEAFTILDPENPENDVKRIKQKSFNISTAALDEEIGATVGKVRKELSKGNFCVVNVKQRGLDDTEFEQFKGLLIKSCLEGDLESKKSYLVIA